jgi:hypothetical protein
MVQLWFIIETIVFVSQVYGGVVFKALQSVWNNSEPYIVAEGDNGDQVIMRDVFKKKSAADYLHIMKFEYLNFVFHASFACVDACAIWDHYENY